MSNYNLTNLTSATDIGDVAAFANAASQGVLYGFGVIAFFFIMLMSLKKTADFDEAFIVSSFLSFIISAILTYGGFLHITFPLVFLVFTAFAGLLMWATK